MARVTVEDCIDKVPNRFDLVLLASHRARMISSGTPITVERDNDKNPVVALREIADTTVSTDDLKEELVHSLQKYVEVDEPEPASVPLIGAPGATVDADDTEGAAALLASLMASADRRMRMGDAGRARAARDYPERAMADGVQAVVERARDRSRWIT